MTISCIIKVGRVQFFVTVKTCQTRFMIQITFGHYFFCFIHHSMAFWTCFKTSFWTFDSCCFQRRGIIRPIFKVLNIFNIARFAVNFLLKEIHNLMKLFLFSKNSLVCYSHLEINIIAIIHQSVASFAGETQFVVATRIWCHFLCLELNTIVINPATDI